MPHSVISMLFRVGQNFQRLGPMRLGSRLGLGALRLVSGLAPFRLVETFCALVCPA